MTANTRGTYTVERHGNEIVYHKAVGVNTHPGLLEIHYNTRTQAGWYRIMLANGVTALRDGGLDWDALMRIRAKYAWVVGERDRTVSCGICGSQYMMKLPMRGSRQEYGHVVTFQMHHCPDCGLIWESEYIRD